MKLLVLSLLPAFCYGTTLTDGLYSCTCENGEAATGSACTSDGTKCASCNEGYDLGGGSCVERSCACENGEAATGRDCPDYVFAKCMSCNDGYYRMDDAWNEVWCEPFVCTCENGEAATGSACTSSGTKCASCESGYVLEGTDCVPVTTCTCDNGSPATGSACTSDGTKCMLCDERFSLLANNECKILLDEANETELMAAYRSVKSCTRD
jgi:hypothetical protein